MFSGRYHNPDPVSQPSYRHSSVNITLSAAINLNENCYCLHVCRAGADLLGFICVPSPRYMTPAKIRACVDALQRERPSPPPPPSLQPTSPRRKSPDGLATETKLADWFQGQAWQLRELSLRSRREVF
jgi:hypothetical protein